MPNKIVFNPQDRFVVAIGDRIVVTTQNGDTFGHDVSGRDISPAFLMNSPDVQAFDAIDTDDGSNQLKGDLPLGGSWSDWKRWE